MFFCRVLWGGGGGGGGGCKWESSGNDFFLFYIRGSANRTSRWKKSNEMPTVCRYLFTAKLLYMFRASIAPIIRST